MRLLTNLSQKKVIVILGVTVFSIFALEFLGELMMIPDGDTSIFKLNGNSMSDHDIANISPIIAILIFLVGAWILYYCKKKNIFYIGIIAVNMLFSCLLLLLFKNDLPYYPPFSDYGYADNLDPRAVIYIWLSYISIMSGLIASIALLISTIVKRKKKPVA